LVLLIIFLSVLSLSGRHVALPLFGFEYERTRESTIVSTLLLVRSHPGSGPHRLLITAPTPRAPISLLAACWGGAVFLTSVWLRISVRWTIPHWRMMDIFGVFRYFKNCSPMRAR